MNTFSVLEQGWIPVIGADGKRQELGILDVLHNASSLREISDASPMTEYSLYRLLSIFLMDALRPNDLEDLEEILEEGSFDFDRIEDYVNLCKSEGVSFDLFDEKRPFLQVPYDPALDKASKTAAVLDYALPTGNNHTHFVHSEENTVLSFPQAARLLISVQLFCTAGVQGYPSNVSSAPPYYTVVKGKNLFETLVFSMVPRRRIPIPFDDPPVLWRNTDRIEPKQLVTNTSWLFGMLFPARSVHLFAEDGFVREVSVLQGLNYKGYWDDPHVTYRMIKDERTPWRPNSEKAVWRNLNDLVDKTKGPYVLRQYFEMEKEADTASLTLYGVQTNQASYLGTYQFDLDIPVHIADDEDRIACLTDCIGAAETLARELRHSLSGIAEIPDGMVSQAVQDYYGRCEDIIWDFCREYFGAKDANLMDAYDAWCNQVIAFVQEARRNALQNLRLHAHAMALAAEKEKEIYYAVKKMREGRKDG